MFSKILQALYGGHVEKRKAKEAEERTMNNPCLLSENERKQANEAKERTLRILSDALKKKESLLVEDPREFGDQKTKYYFCPFITIDLVKELIQELKKATFAKNRDPKQDIEANAYVYPGSVERTIYLCAAFWKMDPESKAQENTIIHEVSHFLEYGHTVQENSDRVQKSPQSMLCPQTAYTLESLLTSFMDHFGTYTNGSYSCCGETSRDTVCENSSMGYYVRLMRKVVQGDTCGDAMASSSEATDWSDADTDTSGEEIYSSGENTDSAGEESDEDMDTSDEEVDTAVVEQTNIDILRLKRQIALMKRQADMLKKRINLLETKTNRMKKQTNLVKKQVNLVKKQINLLKKQTNRLKTQDYMVETLAGMDKTKTTLLKMLTTLLKMLITLLKMLITLWKIEDVVVDRKVDVLETLADMEKTLANVLDQV